MKISIIIPNWNGAEKLKKHLPKVLKVAQKNRIEEIIVVDDSSEDNSLEVLKRDFPTVEVIEKKVNSGFSSTVNLGVSKSTADIFFLLNSDASPDENFLEPALLHFENPKVFSVGCNVGGVWSYAYFKDGYLWHTQAEEKTVNREKSHQTLWASGGSSFFRRSVWEELGGFDTLFDPFYEEDVDLGYRATKRGFLNIWEPKSLVMHYKERGVIATNFSQNQIARIARRNQLILIWKNVTDSVMISSHIKALIKQVFFHPSYILVIIEALKKFPQIRSKRLIERNHSQLSDKEVLRQFE